MLRDTFKPFEDNFHPLGTLRDKVKGASSSLVKVRILHPFEKNIFIDGLAVVLIGIDANHLVGFRVHWAEIKLLFPVFS